FLNAWSSAGKEMAMLGIPVVIYGRNLPLYPVDINYLGETREQYFARIDDALREGWNFEIARRAYRWRVLEFITATIFLGDGYPKVEHHQRSLASRALHRLVRKWDPDYEKKSDVRRRAARLGSARQIHETMARRAVTSLELVEPQRGSTVQVEQETA